MTPIQACKETRDLWTMMARLARKGQAVRKHDVPGPWCLYKHNCPCCEYKVEIIGLERLGSLSLCVDYCPMNIEWKFYATPGYDVCEALRSPYQQWYALCWSGSGNKTPLCIDVEFFCLLIAEMAEEARMRHIAESQPSLVEDKDIEYV